MRRVYGKGYRSLWTVLLAFCFVCAGVGRAQSLISGDIAGVVTDPSGGLVPAATVNLRSLDTGATQSTSTNDQGEYRFPLLKPGRYTVSVSHTGFQDAQLAVDAAVGKIATANFQLSVGQAAQTVEVTSDVTAVSTDSSVITSFTPAQVQALPSPGGDLTNIAFTTPGAVVNVTGGYGNFTVNGLPATSNVFTINGENYMDPYFNVNNTGATNLSLGQNEVLETSIITNPYAGQYGQLSGAQVSYVTRSGTNEFHGNAAYSWNGRAMNANDWFNNFYGTDRPFANANQWAGSFGGPIRKDKTFFFVNTEGIRFVIPNVSPVVIPTPAFANAVLANVQAKQPAEAPIYQKMFNLYANAPGANTAVPLSNAGTACTPSALSLPGFNPATQSCAAQFQAAPTALATEWILTARVDQKITDNDTAFFRYKIDRGTQPTALDPISSNFNAISDQPAWDTQFQETHIFGPRATNLFTASLSHYSVLFSQDHDLASSTFPYSVITFGAVPFTSFNQMYLFPQGRNITQYQFIDDLSVIRGKHSLKFGANFRRYDISDHTFFYTSPTVYFGYTNDGLQNFANGKGYQYRQSLNQANNVPIAMWGLGVYAQDEWSVKPGLKLTLALRVERNSNPVCQINCLANFKGSWNTLPSVTAADPTTVPYSADIAYNQHSAFPGVDTVNLSPRFGFNWSPGRDGKTVISGGFGLFYDAPTAGIVSSLLANPPVSVGIRVRPTAGVLPFDPGPQGGAAIWQASANAFSINQTYSQISANLAALGSVFAPPSFTTVTGTLHAPQWQEWNLQVQRQISNSVVVSANYVGNHGIRIPYTNGFLNAFDQFEIYPNAPGTASSLEPAVPNYGVVNSIQSGAISNYHGLSLTLSKRFSHWFSGHFNYTLAHNMDEVSNGGIFQYNKDTLFGQLNPTSLRAGNYGPSEYDIRNNFTADFVVTPEVHSGRIVNLLVNGWTWSGKVFWRSGLPFSVVDGNTVLGNYNGSLLATPAISGPLQTSCGRSAAVTPCINASSFLDINSIPTFPGWSNQGRNSFRGPNFFNSDMSLTRAFKIRERLSLAVGVQAYNVFNHPNFAFPDFTLGSPTFGKITEMASSPTSPYGNFLGFDSSPRVAQITGRITF